MKVWKLPSGVVRIAGPYSETPRSAPALCAGKNGETDELYPVNTPQLLAQRPHCNWHPVICSFVCISPVIRRQHRRCDMQAVEVFF